MKLFYKRSASIIAALALSMNLTPSITNAESKVVVEEETVNVGFIREG